MSSAQIINLSVFHLTSKTKKRNLMTYVFDVLVTQNRIVDPGAYGANIVFPPNNSVNEGGNLTDIMAIRGTKNIIINN